MATPDESLMVAARRMADQDTSDLVVVEELKGETHPVGMLSEHDLVRALARDVLSVREGMRTDMVTVREDEGVDSAIATMNQYGARTVPVVDENFRVQGMVGIDTLIAARRPGSGVSRALGGGAVAGVLAGAILAAVMAAVYALLGHDVAAVLARDAIAIEVASCVGLAVFWGAMFGLFVYGLSRALTLFSGLLWGVVAWLGMAYVALPMLDVAAPPIVPAVAAFVGFGMLVAAGFLPFQRTLTRYSGQ